MINDKQILMKYFHEQWLCGVYIINFEIWGKEKMGGIKSYEIHIKLDLMYPLLMEKILITSRINTLQIMYLKAADILKHV